MTEVPEHLLRRSQERRAALGLGGGDAPAPAAPAAEASPPATAAATPAPAAAATADTAAAAPPPPPPEPTYIAPPPPSRRVPLWMMPVLVALPFWAIIYMGAFGPRGGAKAPPTPAELYATNCSSCHGAHGEGGVGPKLAGGQAKLTFPNIDDQIKWVHTGSAPVTGQKYGSPTRPGGQHGPATGGMPAFAGKLTDAQILQVVKYERDVLK